MQGLAMMATRPHPAPPLTTEEAALVQRWPDLNTLPRRDWTRAAAHLEAAHHARETGTPCPWCEPTEASRQ